MSRGVQGRVLGAGVHALGMMWRPHRVQRRCTSLMFICELGITSLDGLSNVVALFSRQAGTAQIAWLEDKCLNSYTQGWCFFERSGTAQIAQLGDEYSNLLLRDQRSGTARFARLGDEHHSSETITNMTLLFSKKL